MQKYFKRLIGQLKSAGLMFLVGLLLFCMPWAGGCAQELVQAVEATCAPFSFDEDQSAMRGVSWDMSLEEVAQREGVKAKKKTVVVSENVELYSNTVSKLTYVFEDGLLVSRTFTLKDAKNYDSAVYSVFMRYGAPFMLNKKNATWELLDMQITSVYQGKSTITFTVKRGK